MGSDKPYYMIWSRSFEYNYLLYNPFKYITLIMKTDINI